MDDLPPDLAKKALAADVRNTIQQVADGGTLAQTKRQLFLGVVTDSASPEEILKSRESSLLQKFAAGGRLKKEELAEIAHLLPSGQALYSKILTHECYKKRYADYAVIYGVALSTIKWWIRQGKKNTKGPDLPPLDAPREMPAWWEKDRGNMKQRCPDHILSIASSDHSAHPAPCRPSTHEGEAPATSPTPRTPSAPCSPVAPAEKFSVFTSDFETNLHSVRLQSALATKDLNDALAADPADPSKIEQCRRRLKIASDSLMDAEERSLEYFEKRERLVELNDIAQDLSPMLSAVADEIRSLRRKLKPRLAMAADEAEEDAIWQSGIDEVFTELDRTDYTQPFRLASVA